MVKRTVQRARCSSETSRQVSSASARVPNGPMSRSVPLTISSKPSERNSPPTTQKRWLDMANLQSWSRVGPAGLFRRDGKGCPLELRALGRLRHCRRRGGAAGDREADQIEVAGADLALMARRRVALCLRCEFRVLQLAIGTHPAREVVARQREHAVI